MALVATDNSFIVSGVPVYSDQRMQCSVDSHVLDKICCCFWKMRCFVVVVSLLALQESESCQKDFDN